MAVTNVQRITRETASPAVTRFTETQSLEARTRKRRLRPANDTSEKYTPEAETDSYAYSDDTVPQSALRSGTEDNSKPVSLAVRRAFLGVELAIAAACSFIQGMFALYAVAFIAFGQMTVPIIGVKGDQVAEFAGSAVGEIVMPVVRFFDWIFGNPLHTDLLPQALPANLTGIGLAIWGIGAFFTLGGFIAILLLFYFQRVRVFDDVLLLVATICAISLSLIPGLQLLPWMVPWVFAVHTSTTVKKIFS